MTSRAHRSPIPTGRRSCAQPSTITKSPTARSWCLAGRAASASPSPAMATGMGTVAATSTNFIPLRDLPPIRACGTSNAPVSGEATVSTRAPVPLGALAPTTSATSPRRPPAIARVPIARTTRSATEETAAVACANTRRRHPAIVAAPVVRAVRVTGAKAVAACAPRHHASAVDRHARAWDAHAEAATAANAAARRPRAVATTTAPRALARGLPARATLPVPALHLPPAAIPVAAVAPPVPSLPAIISLPAPVEDRRAHAI